MVDVSDLNKNMFRFLVKLLLLLKQIKYFSKLLYVAVRILMNTASEVAINSFNNSLTQRN